MTIISAIVVAIAVTPILLAVHVFAELQLHKAGRDVHEWTRKLASYLAK
jgi:hypothetical protein